jgi:hypothetical protein
MIKFFVGVAAAVALLISASDAQAFGKRGGRGNCGATTSGSCNTGFTSGSCQTVSGCQGVTQTFNSGCPTAKYQQGVTQTFASNPVSNTPVPNIIVTVNYSAPVESGTQCGASGCSIRLRK